MASYPNHGMADPSLPSGRQDVVVVVPVVAQQSVNGLPTRCSGRQPQQFYCVACQKAQVSSTHHKLGLGSLTWAACCIVFVMPCLFCLPLCCPACQEVEHRCPQCKREVGKNRFIFGDE